MLTSLDFAEQVQDMNLQPKVVRMAEMEELRVEVFLYCFLITDPLLFWLIFRSDKLSLNTF